MSPANAEADASRKCPECGIRVTAGRDRCWLCGQKVVVALAHRVRARRSSGGGGALRFQLDSLLLTVTLLSLCFGLARVAPEVTLGLLVLLAFAYLRTALVLHDGCNRASSLGVWGKIVLFAQSLLIVVAVPAAGLVVLIGTVVACYLGVRCVGLWTEDVLWGVLVSMLFGTVGVFLAVTMSFLTGYQLWGWKTEEATTAMDESAAADTTESARRMSKTMPMSPVSR